RPGTDNATVSYDHAGVNKCFCGNPDIVPNGNGLCNSRKSGLRVIVGACTQVCPLGYGGPETYFDFSLRIQNCLIGHPTLIRKLQVPWSPYGYFWIYMDSLAHFCSKNSQQEGPPAM